MDTSRVEIDIVDEVEQVPPLELLLVPSYKTAVPRCYETLA